jgi:hypothetical protein
VQFFFALSGRGRGHSHGTAQHEKCSAVPSSFRADAPQRHRPQGAKKNLHSIPLRLEDFINHVRDKVRSGNRARPTAQPQLRVRLQKKKPYASKLPLFCFFFAEPSRALFVRALTPQGQVCVLLPMRKSHAPPQPSPFRTGAGVLGIPSSFGHTDVCLCYRFQ